MSGRVVHFEIPYHDGERARGFYERVFGGSSPRRRAWATRW